MLDETMTYQSEYSTVSTDPVVGTVFGLVYLIFVVFAIACVWKIFVKAGEAGWKSIVPFLSSYVLVKIAGKPGWWFLLFFIPVANIVVMLLVSLGLAEKFGKSSAFGVLGLFIFSFVGYPMLAFGDATYHGNIDAPPQPPMPDTGLGQAPSQPLQNAQPIQPMQVDPVSAPQSNATPVVPTEPVSEDHSPVVPSPQIGGQIATTPQAGNSMVPPPAANDSNLNVIPEVTTEEPKISG